MSVMLNVLRMECNYEDWFCTALLVEIRGKNWYKRKIYLPVSGSLVFYQIWSFSSFLEWAVLRRFFPQLVFPCQFLGRKKRWLGRDQHIQIWYRNTNADISKYQKIQIKQIHKSCQFLGRKSGDWRKILKYKCNCK